MHDLATSIPRIFGRDRLNRHSRPSDEGPGAVCVNPPVHLAENIDPATWTKKRPGHEISKYAPSHAVARRGALAAPLGQLCGEGSEGRQAASVRLSQGLEGIRGTWFNHCQRRHELNPHSALALFGVLPAPRQSAHQAMGSRNPSTFSPSKGIPPQPFLANSA